MHFNWRTRRAPVCERSVARAAKMAQTEARLRTPILARERREVQCYRRATKGGEERGAAQNEARHRH
jgi:hypothetical protein